MPTNRLAPAALAAAILATALAGGLSGCSGPGVEARSIEHLSPVYTVDREYRSMRGPASTQKVGFPQGDEPELVWVTGYRASMVGEDGETPVSQEYMCHSNLDFNAARHSALLGLPVYHTNRLFTLSQGQFEIQFPEGFGIPYYTDESFSLTTQVLNLNPDGQMRRMRHKVSIDYVLDRELEQPMKPLFMTSGWGLVLIDGEDGYFGEADPSEEEHGPGCLPGDSAGQDNYTDEFQREFAGHWVVKPGREVNRTLVTNIMKIPYDTTVHYIAVHLHPFAESLELLDLATGETVFKSDVEAAEDKIGISRVQYFSSVEGIPVYRDHEYELVSTYNNTTSEDQDSMAVMLLYLLDKKFKKTPRTAPPVKRMDLPVNVADERLLLHTTYGDVEIVLYPAAAPNHVKRILELTRLGVYDGVPFSRIEPGFLVQLGYPQARSGPALTAGQSAVITPLTAEFNDIEHRRGIVSMVLNDNADPNSADASFFILLGDAKHLDGSYTVVGRVARGMEALDRMAQVPLEGNRPIDPIEISSAEIVSRAGAVARR